MGNSDSTPSDSTYYDIDKFDGVETLGYRVLGVQPNSPASNAGLVSFFDFLVGCNGRMLFGGSVDAYADEADYRPDNYEETKEEGDNKQNGDAPQHEEEEEEEEEVDDDVIEDVDFPELLRQSVGQELELLVWNIKSQSERLVRITPSSDWGGMGLLGVTIRVDDYADADERLIRVLQVEDNSPAAVAGLSPQTDYLLGTTTTSFDDDNVLAHVLRSNVDKVIELYVYNTESDVVRVVSLMATLSWGGRGLLGAEVGTGYLHKLPKDCRSTSGKSVERKVRTGVAPSMPPAGPVTARAIQPVEPEPQNLPPSSSDTGESTKPQTPAGSGTSAVPQPPQPTTALPPPPKPDETVDLDALTATVAGSAIATPDSEAAALFAGPPPPTSGDASANPTEGASSESHETYTPSAPLPPPPTMSSLSDVAS